MTVLLILATALMLGALHAFDVDHLAAVTAYVARRPDARASFTFAGLWGAGHAVTLLVVGVGATLLRVVVSPDLQWAAEMAVGGTLVAVGTWVLVGLVRGRLLLEPHEHEEGRPHTHLHRPAHSRSRRAGHSIFWVGALHGLAGSAGFLVVIPIAMTSSAASVAAYILVFSLGVTAAMAIYALTIGASLRRSLRGSVRWYPWIAGTAGAATLLLGIAWLGATVAHL